MFKKITVSIYTTWHFPDTNLSSSDIRHTNCKLEIDNAYSLKSHRLRKLEYSQTRSECYRLITWKVFNHEMLLHSGSLYNPTISVLDAAKRLMDPKLSRCNIQCAGLHLHRQTVCIRPEIPKVIDLIWWGPSLMAVPFKSPWSKFVEPQIWAWILLLLWGYNIVMLKYLDTVKYLHKERVGLWNLFLLQC